MSRRLPIVQFQSDVEKLVYVDYFNAISPAGSQHSLSLFQFPSAISVQTFFRLSKLPKHVLQKIWDYVDQGAMTMFDQNTFNVGLRMIAIAQFGQEPNLLGLNTFNPNQLYVPRFAGYEHVLLRIGLDVRKVPWKIDRVEYEKYRSIFLSLFPFGRDECTQEQSLSFDLGIKYFEQSRVNPAFLNHVWFLADYNQDMFLDLEEFCVAMHLISGLVEGKYVPLPNCLPIELIPPNKRGGLDESSSQSTSSENEKVPSRSSFEAGYDWTVSDGTRSQANVLWQRLSDGKQVLTKASIPAIKSQYQIADAFMELAWSLIDVQKNEMINFEQFEYLLHVVENISMGQMPPHDLPQELYSKFTQIPLGLLSKTAPQLSPRKTSISRRTIKPAASPLKPRNLEVSASVNPQFSLSSQTIQMPKTDTNEPNRRKSHYPSQYSDLTFFDQPAARETDNPFSTEKVNETAETKNFMDLDLSADDTPKKPKMRSASTFESPTNSISSRISFFDQIPSKPSSNHATPVKIIGSSNFSNDQAVPSNIIAEQLEKLKRRNRILENCIREARVYLQNTCA